MYNLAMSDVKSMQWRRLTAEAAAIVLSILLAFAIDAWWQFRGDREAEQVVLANLLVEFKRNRVELDRTLRSLTENQDAAQRLLTFTGRDLTGEDSAAIKQEINKMNF